VRIVFGERVWCPDCGRQCHVQALRRNELWRCRKCRNRFSLTSVTWLRGMKLTLVQVWALLWCWQRKLPVQQARDLLGLSVPTVRRWYGLFRDNLSLDFDVVLEGNVQMDEMFVRGGFVIGAKDIRRKRLRLKVVSAPYPTKSDAARFVQEHVRPGSVLCTDGGGIYRGIERSWPLEHVRDIHSRFEFSITSEIEGAWANLRTFMRRMYHHVTFAKLPKVVAEFEARNSRPEMFESPLEYLKNSLVPVRLAL